MRNLSKYLAFVVLLLFGLIVACTPMPIPTSPAASPTAAPVTATPIPTATSTSVPPTAPALSAVEGTSTAIQKVELQFWHGQNQAQRLALNGLIDRFNATHPSLQVKAKHGTYNELQFAVASGSPPDLALAYQSDVANLVKANAIIPLDDLMKDSETGFSADDLKDIFPAFIDRYPQFGHRVYSLAFMRNMQAMYYNADLLKAAGFSKPPETWDDFMKACAAVSKPPDAYCYEMTPDAATFATWVLSRGGELLSADGKQAAFDQKVGLDTLTFLNDLFAKKYAIVAAKAFQDQIDFSLGKVAFTFDTTAGLPAYDRVIKSASKPITWGIAPSPRTVKEPVVILYGPSVTIFRTTPEKQRAAFVFLKWLVGNDPNAEWIQATASFPARQSTKSALADLIAKNLPYGQAFSWLQYGRGEPSAAAWNPIRTFIADALIAVATGKAKPADALRDAAAKANAELAK
jgi:ABC-type glycerol-3-phosphate transport system substrate-binding protein